MENTYLLICSKCEWKVDQNFRYELDDLLPPCPVCESVMEGFKVIEKVKG